MANSIEEAMKDSDFWGRTLTLKEMEHFARFERYCRNQKRLEFFKKYILPPLCAVIAVLIADALNLNLL